MHVAKAQLVEILRARGDHDLADRANAELPAEIDSEQHAEFFRGLDLPVDPGDAARHGAVGHEEDMQGLASESSESSEDR